MPSGKKASDSPECNSLIRWNPPLELEGSQGDINIKEGIKKSDKSSCDKTTTSVVDKEIIQI